jgi:hypothetical protein
MKEIPAGVLRGGEEGRAGVMGNRPGMDEKWDMGNVPPAA